MLQDFGRGRLLVVNCRYLVRREVLVEDRLQAESCGSFIVRVQTEAISHLAPCQFLVGDLVVAAMLDDMAEDLEKIHMRRADLGLGVEASAALLVIGCERRDEVVVLGRAINRVLGASVLRSHPDGMYRSWRQSCWT